MIPDAKRTQIIDALRVNPNATGVARELGGVSAASVKLIAKAANIDLGRSGPKKISAEKRAQIIEALRTDPNASAIARRFGGMSYKVVTRIAERANIKLGPAAQRAAREMRQAEAEASQRA